MLSAAGGGGLGEGEMLIDVGWGVVEESLRTAFHSHHELMSP